MTEDVLGSEANKDVPSLDDAKQFICQRLGLSVEEVRWDRFNVRESRAGSSALSLPWEPDVFRFRSNTGTDCSLVCFYSRQEDIHRFTMLNVSEFKPIPGTDSMWQKTFRFDTLGEIHLSARRLEGKELKTRPEMFQISSEFEDVRTNRVEIPAGLTRLTKEEKKEMLRRDVRAILAKNGLLQGQESVEKDIIPLLPTAKSVNELQG